MRNLELFTRFLFYISMVTAVFFLMSYFTWAVEIQLDDRCPKPKLVGQMDKHAEDTLAVARKRCRGLYPAFPCVKVFERKDFQTYTVTCGKEKPRIFKWR